MLVKYYLSDNIKAPFKDFTLGLEMLGLALTPPLLSLHPIQP